MEMEMDLQSPPRRTGAVVLLQVCWAASSRSPHDSGGGVVGGLSGEDWNPIKHMWPPHLFSLYEEILAAFTAERKVDYVLSHSFMLIPIIKLTGYVVISGGRGRGALAQAHKRNPSGRNVVTYVETGADFLLQTKSSTSTWRALQVHN